MIGQVHTDGGDFVGRDKHIYGNVNYGDTIYHSPVVQTIPTAPSPPLHFAGRSQELTWLHEHLSAVPGSSVAIHAMGGIGKTTLAKAFCQQKNNPFQAVLWAELGQTPDVASILQIWGSYAMDRFAIPFNVRLEDTANYIRSLLTSLLIQTGSERVLVVLDNCWDNTICYEAIALLRLAAPLQTNFLITTRQEAVIRQLQSQKLSLQEVPCEDALQLLNHLLANSAVSSLHIERTITLLRGHPLALELAATHLNGAEDGSHVDDILTEYEETIQQSIAKARFSPHVGEEEQDEFREDEQFFPGLYAVFEHSYQALATTHHQSYFCILGLLAPDSVWIRELAGALWAIEEPKINRAIHNTLRLNGLIQQDEQDTTSDETWYRQHQLLRTYAWTLLKAGKHDLSVENLADRYADYIYSAVINSAMDRRGKWPSLFQLQPHIYEVCDYLAKHDELDTAMLMQILLDRYLLRFGLFQVVIHRHEYLIALIEQNEQKELSPKLKMLHLTNLGTAYLDIGETEKALELYRAANTIASIEEDAADISGVFGKMATCLLRQRKWQRAFLLYEQALDAGREAGIPSLQGKWLIGIGNCYVAQGKTSLAREQYQEANRVIQQGHHSQEITIVQIRCLNNLGLCNEIQGDTTEAIQNYQQAFKLATDNEDMKSKAVAAGNLGRCYNLMGKQKIAHNYLRQALELCEQAGLLQLKANTLHSLAELYTDQQDLQQAFATAKYGIALGNRLIDPQILSEHFVVMAYLALVEEDYAEAQIAAEHAQNQHYLLNRHYAYILGGIAQLHQNQFEVAQQTFTAALQHTQTLLTNDPRNFWAYYLQMLSYCGLQLSGVHGCLSAALDSGRQAKKLNRCITIVARVSTLVEMLVGADENKDFEEIRALLNGDCVEAILTDHRQ